MSIHIYYTYDNFVLYLFVVLRVEVILIEDTYTCTGTVGTTDTLGTTGIAGIALIHRQ